MSRGICYHPVRWISGRGHGQRQKYLHAGSHRYFLVQVRRSTSEVEVQGDGRKNSVKVVGATSTEGFPVLRCNQRTFAKRMNEQSGTTPKQSSVLVNTGRANCTIVCSRGSCAVTPWKMPSLFTIFFTTRQHALIFPPA